METTLICGLDEFAQHFWFGCIWRHCFPASMHGEHAEKTAFVPPSEAILVN